MPPFASKIDASFSTETKSKSSIMASVEAFKSAVTRIRDILRGPGVAITGMDSMRHICLYLLSRYMTKAKVKSLGVPDEFAWENLIETAQTKNGGVQKALDCFFHKEADCLVNHFDRLFGTENFSFDIKNPAKHKEMLEIIDKINMEGVDCQMDILGWVYEQHLKTGSSAARDLGQFFTDRFICDYMVNICKPGFKGKGVPESVCDPSMGTGGFLTSYIKFYKKHHADKSVDWSIQNKEIHGCDTDPKVAGVARLNLFMESGGNRAVNLRTHDSLYGDLTQTGYDLILANMPFGLKGIKHAECCERVNKLKIRGTKSEPLFLQLMMVSLNRGGRCAVVVPDGMLVNGSTCHDETRKYLLDNFELKRVIKMKGQFFMNTGIQPSILFFENTGKPTSVVEFWDVIKGANGDIEETMVLSVPRAKFDASCSFDMRRYQEVKPVANPAGFPMAKLSDVCKFVGGKGNQDRSSEYTIPYYESNGIFGFVKDALYIGEYVITARCMSIGAVHYVNGAFYPSDHTINMTSSDTTKLNNRFLYFWLLLNNKVLNDMSSGIKPGIRKSDVMEIKMPLPPLETQQEIVATLDRIYAPGTTELAETLKLTDKAMDLVLANPGGASLEPIVEAQRLMRKSAQMVADVKAQMVADVKAQMVAIMRSVNMRGFEMKKLDDCVSILRGNLVKSDEDASKNIYPYYAGKRITGYAPTYAFEGDKFMLNYRVNTTDNVTGLCQFVSGKYNCSRFSWVMSNRDDAITNIKYMYYYLDSYNFTGMATGTSIKEINSTNLKQVLLPIPPIDFQVSLVKRMNELESQLISLENLGKQAEDNARFILDSYLNTA
jgi:restriction endonuclease S subunit